MRGSHLPKTHKVKFGKNGNTMRIFHYDKNSLNKASDVMKQKVKCKVPINKSTDMQKNNIKLKMQFLW